MENIFPLDADDLTIKKCYRNSISIIEKTHDFIFCDHEWIENNVNQRKIALVMKNIKEIKKKDL